MSEAVQHGERFRATHAPCGDAVETDLPPGYPVAEGVGLWCPRCDVAFWHVPEAPSVAAEEPVPAAEATGPGRSRWNWRFAGPTAAAFLLIAGLAVVAATTSDETDEAPPAASTPAAAVPAEATPAPSITPLDAGGYAVDVPVVEGWEPTLEPGRVDRVLTATAGGGRVAISTRPLRGRSLTRLARDARRSLRAELPRHRVTRGARLQLNGRRAMRLTARRGRDAREVTVLAVGDQRYLIVLDLDRTASREVRRGGRELADGVTIR